MTKEKSCLNCIWLENTNDQDIFKCNGKIIDIEYPCKFYESDI
jgi:hypothetical protein